MKYSILFKDKVRDWYEVDVINGKLALYQYWDNLVMQHSSLHNPIALAGFYACNQGSPYFEYKAVTKNGGKEVKYWLPEYERLEKKAEEKNKMGC